MKTDIELIRRKLGAFVPAQQRVQEPSRSDAFRSHAPDEVATRLRGLDAFLAAKRGVDEGLVHWLVHGERTAASDALYALLTGHRVSCVKPTVLPSNAADIRACRLLLVAAGKLAERFSAAWQEMGSWCRVAALWEAICASMDREAPDWRDGCATAPQTEALLRSLLVTH